MAVNEFISKFDHLIAKAGLTEEIHNDLLITLFEATPSLAVIDWIYARQTLLTRFSSWKTHATNIGAMLQCQNAMCPA